MVCLKVEKEKIILVVFQCEKWSVYQTTTWFKACLLRFFLKIDVNFLSY